MSYLINPFFGAPADPSISFVKLLLGFEGSDASTTLTDESAAAHGTATANSGAQIDTAQFKFGASSGLFAGGSDSFSWADSVDWRLAAANSDPSTVEGFVRFNARTTNHVLAQQYGTIGNFGWRIYVPSGSLTNLQFDYSSNGSAVTSITTSSAGLGNSTWYHFAVDHDTGGKIRIFVDGVMRGSSTPADSSIFNSTSTMQVGGGSSLGLNGWIDEFRLTKGASRYGSDSSFTPPSAAFPRS